MKTERTLHCFYTDNPISMTDHLLCLCKMMEASEDIITENLVTNVA